MRQLREIANSEAMVAAARLDYFARGSGGVSAMLWVWSMCPGCRGRCWVG